MHSGKLFLGVDGGQSHTEAIVADESGKVLGRGIGGPSVSSDFAGGEQLEKGVREALTAAFGTSEIPMFHSAHFGLTGELHEEKKLRLSEFITAEIFSVGNDAPSALYGATSGRPGIIVIAGTGSVVYGENDKGESARAGGLGYMFSDEGSGFWLGAQAIRFAILESDGLIPNSGIESLVCAHFGCQSITEVVSDFYRKRITRDKVAAIAKTLQERISSGELAVLKDELDKGAALLAEKVRVVSERLKLGGAVEIYGVGGMFRGSAFPSMFSRHLKSMVSGAELRAPLFGPGEGALMLAFKQAGVEINAKLLENLQESLR